MTARRRPADQGWASRFGLPSSANVRCDFWPMISGDVVVVVVVACLRVSAYAGFERGHSGPSRGESPAVVGYRDRAAHRAHYRGAGVALDRPASSSPATADEYLHVFHDPKYPLPFGVRRGTVDCRCRDVGEWCADRARRPVALPRCNTRRRVATAVPVLIFGAEPQAAPRGGCGCGCRRVLQSARDRCGVRGRSALPN